MKSLIISALLCLFSSAVFADVALIRYYDGADGPDYQSSGPDVTPNTPFAIASVGKAMTAVAVARLVDEGKLDWDQMAKSYLPNAIVRNLGGMRGIKLKHLLRMSSGLPDYYGDTYIDDALNDPDFNQTAENAIAYAYGEDPYFSPGAEYDYSNTGYVLAGMIMERVTGKTYAQLIKELVLEPAGMSKSFVFGSQPLPADFPHGHEDGQEYRDYYTGNGFGDGGVISTANDLARFYRGMFIDRTLIPVAQMKAFLRDPIGEGYAMGVEIEDGIVGHSGGDIGFSADVRMDMEYGDIAIMFVAEGGADVDWTWEQF